MLYTIKQIKRGVISLVVSGFARARVDDLAIQINNAENIDGFIVNNEELVKEFIKLLDKNKNGEISVKETEKYLKAFNRITAGISISEYKVNEILEKLKDFIKERSDIIVGTQVELIRLRGSFKEELEDFKKKNKTINSNDKDSVAEFSSVIIATKLALKDLDYISGEISTADYDSILTSALANFIEDFNSDRTTTGDIKEVSGSVINKDIANALLKALGGSRNRVSTAKRKRESLIEPQDNTSPVTNTPPRS
jgi:hypothetical protein